MLKLSSPPFSTVADVRRLIDTDMKDSDILATIMLSDQEIVARSLTRGANVELISALFAAQLIQFTKPASKGVGQYRDAINPQQWRDYAENVIQKSQFFFRRTT